MEGIVRALSKRMKELRGRVPDYNRGEWIRELYGPKVGRKRAFIKMHVSFDIRSRRIVSLRVTDERVRDHEMFRELLEDALEKCNVYRVLADKGYDTGDNFNYLDERRIDI